MPTTERSWSQLKANATARLIRYRWKALKQFAAVPVHAHASEWIFDQGKIEPVAMLSGIPVEDVTGTLLPDNWQEFVLIKHKASYSRRHVHVAWGSARKYTELGKVRRREVDMYLIKFSYLLYNLCINQIISTYNLLFGLLARHSLLASSGDRWYIRRYINPWIETPNNIITGGNIPPTLPLLE